MKTTLTILILLLTCLSLRSQIAFNDAIKLRNLGIGANLPDTNIIELLNKEEIMGILKYYVPAKDANLNGKIGNDFIGNPFIQFKNIPTGGNPPLGNDTKFHFTLPNLNVTNIADGLAQFLIKRGKEELNIAFFNRFKEFLNDPEHEECKILFPKTADFLEKIESYEYAAFLQSLRESFYDDLSNLIIHLNQVINLPKYNSLIIQKHPEIKLVIGTINIVSELSQAGDSIAIDSIIWQLATLPWGQLGNNPVSKNVSNSFKFLNIISESLRDASLQRSWVQLSELNKKLFFDDSTLRIYFGLLYQQVKMSNISFYSENRKDSIRVDAFLQQNKDHIYMLSSMIENFALLANDVNKSIEDYGIKKDAHSLSNNDYYTYINKAINIVDYGFKAANLINPDFKVINDKYIGVARNTTDLYKNIYTKNYNNAVMNVCAILDSLLPPGHIHKILPVILKYGNFMASVVKAESAEEVEHAIEATALPAGSSSIKKNSVINVSLNAYLGGYFGRASNSTDAIDGNSSRVGVTAPVGIAVSRSLGHFKNGNSIGALSIYGTILDVGAVAGYRLNDDSTKLDSKITLNDIFAPGGYLVYGMGLPIKGFSYIPLSIGYGWQYGAKLYYKKDDGKLAVSDKSRWRGNWFIAIDIPLVNFYNRNYKKQK